MTETERRRDLLEVLTGWEHTWRGVAKVMSPTRNEFEESYPIFLEALRLANMAKWGIDELKNKADFRPIEDTMVKEGVIAKGEYESNDGGALVLYW